MIAPQEFRMKVKEVKCMTFYRVIKLHQYLDSWRIREQSQRGISEYKDHCEPNRVLGVDHQLKVRVDMDSGVIVVDFEFPPRISP